MESKETVAEQARPVTLKDVAGRAGVSFQTVSFVINNRPGVAAATRTRVLQAIEDLHYTPNAVARGLRHRETRIISLIVPDIVNLYYAELVQGAEEMAQRCGYMITVASTQWSHAREVECVTRLRANRVDGVILASGGNDESHIRSLMRSGIPVVVVDRSASSVPSDVPSVSVDNVQAMCQATSYLIGLGHSRIGYITEPLTVQTVKDRMQGYKKALRQAGVTFDTSLVRISEEMQHDKLRGGYETAGSLLRASPRPSAVIAVPDPAAFGVMRAAADGGLSVPNDLSLVGFNDVGVASYSVPRLTTVRQPKFEMGSKAVELLLQLRAGEHPLEPHVVLDTELVERESCAPYRR